MVAVHFESRFALDQRIPCGCGIATLRLDPSMQQYQRDQHEARTHRDEDHDRDFGGRCDFVHKRRARPVNSYGPASIVHGCKGRDLFCARDPDEFAHVRLLLMNQELEVSDPVYKNRSM